MTSPSSEQSPTRKATPFRSVFSDALFGAAVIGGAMYAAGEKPVPHFFSRVVPILLLAIFAEAFLANRYLRKEETGAPESQGFAIFGAIAGALGVGYLTWIILWAGWRSEVHWQPVAFLAVYAGARRYRSARNLPHERRAMAVLLAVLLVIFVAVPQWVGAAAR